MMLLLCCCLVAKSCLVFFDPMDYIAHQAPLSLGFPRQEYWSALPFPPPGDLPDPGIQSTSPVLAGGVFVTELPGKLDACGKGLFPINGGCAAPWEISQMSHESSYMGWLERTRLTASAHRLTFMGTYPWVMALGSHEMGRGTAVWRS